MPDPDFPIVFTDLDGTLLDHHTYEFGAASEALKALKERHIPLILNTSKTMDESIALSKRLGICCPLIVENGGAVILPCNYVTALGHIQTAVWNNERTIIALGATKQSITDVLSHANETLLIDDCYQSFSNMTTQQLMEATGLASDDAIQAKNRQYSEPLLWHGSADMLAELSAYLQERNFRLIKGGRFHHVIGNSDKRTAMEYLASMYQNGAKRTGDARIIALGDGANDLSMLEGADIAVIVRNDTQPEFALEHPELIRTNKSGPAGWQEAMNKILSRF